MLNKKKLEQLKKQFPDLGIDVAGLLQELEDDEEFEI